jgi:N-formylmaleamate deformylase
MTAWKTARLEVNTTILHYRRMGRGVPMVLAHGLGDSSDCWPMLAPRLAGRVELIAYDARGHGESARCGSYGSADHVADLRGLIQALDLAPAVLYGHSMGAATCAELAGESPALVRALILEDPPWRRLEEQPGDLEIAIRRANLLAGQSVPLERLIAAARQEYPNYDPAELEPWARAKQQADAGIFGWLSSQHPPWQEVVQRIVCPTLLLTGDAALGAIVSDYVAAELVKRNPHLHHVQVTGADHSIRRSQFLRVIVALEQFLDEVLLTRVF